MKPGAGSDCGVAALLRDIVASDVTCTQPGEQLSIVMSASGCSITDMTPCGLMPTCQNAHRYIQAPCCLYLAAGRHAVRPLVRRDAGEQDRYTRHYDGRAVALHQICQRSSVAALTQCMTCTAASMHTLAADNEDGPSVCCRDPLQTQWQMNKQSQDMHRQTLCFAKDAALLSSRVARRLHLIRQGRQLGPSRHCEP
jgi:hypothetical protein